MPNHCNNSIHISTSIPFDTFLDHDEEGYSFSFNKVVPMPKLLSHTIKGGWTKKSFTIFGKTFQVKQWQNIKNDIICYLAIKIYGYDNWYDWSLANWGTKWDAYDCNLTIEEDLGSGGERNAVYVSFDTAWSPPIEFYEKLFAFLINKDPGVLMDATYYEPGCCIVGTWDNGTDFQETWYDTYYLDELDCDVISDENNELISDVQRDNYSNLITLSEALQQIKDDEDLHPETKAELTQELSEYFHS